jgi:uncharacterized membrane protein
MGGMITNIWILAGRPFEIHVSIHFIEFNSFLALLHAILAPVSMMSQKPAGDKKTGQRRTEHDYMDQPEGSNLK